jgi:hypothetical protein
MLGIIIQFLKQVRGKWIQELPPEYQACESCREPKCNTARAKICEYRLQAELEEESRRNMGS